VTTIRPMSQQRGVAERTFLPEIFAISAAALLLEISYTRIVSFKLYYYYTYLTIGLALLGLGSGAVIVAVSARIKRTSTERLLLWCSVAAAAGVVIGYLVIARMPLDTLALWRPGRRQQLVSLSQLVGICLGLYVTFLPVGMAIAALFARRPDRINRLYASDLAGAALACLLAVPVMAWVGPVSAVAATAVILLLVALRLARGAPRWVAAALGVAVVVAAVVTMRPGLAPDIRTEETKQLRPGADIDESRWSALFRVDAVRFPGNVVLFHDGLWGSAIWEWDGDPESLTRFDTDERSVPFAALGTPPERLLIIGAAGGNEVQAGLRFGAGQIDAVELNPETAKLLRGPFAEYSGNIASHPQVNYVVGDGRSYLAERNNRYDMIWFVAPDSYSASNAASSGAFVLSESFLYTQEMLEESLRRLTPDGMVVMQFGERDYDAAPNRTARLVATAREAYRALGIEAVDDHVAVVTSPPGDVLYSVATTMMKVTPFTAEETARIESKTGEVPDLRVRHLPGRPGDDPLRPVNTVLTGGVDALVDYPFEVGPINDNRPFFWHFTPFSQEIRQITTPVDDLDVEVGVGERVLLVLLGISIVMAAVFLLGPFVLVRRTWRALPDKKLSVPVFGLLGLAFIAFEITLIQKFALFLGYPTYSLTVTLMSILLFTGVGALLSPRFHARPDRLLASLAALIVVLGLFYAFAVPTLTESLLAWPTLVKAAIVVLWCAPLGLCLGMFMPLAITMVAVREPTHTAEYVAWGWAINGFFSVIGSILTTVLSMSYGFRFVLLLSVVLYLVAIVVLRLWARRIGSLQPPPPSASALEQVELVPDPVG
jgi:spermidine synthase